LILRWPDVSLDVPVRAFLGAILPLMLIALCLTVASKAIPAPQYWYREDLAIELEQVQEEQFSATYTIITTIYPTAQRAGGTWSWFRYYFWGAWYQDVQFERAWEVSTDANLRTDVELNKWSGRNFTVLFPGPRSDGYRFVVRLRIPSPIPFANSNSFIFAWGGEQTHPINVTVTLPPQFILDYVEPHYSFSTSNETGRITMQYQGLVLAPEGMRWTIHYHKELPPTVEATTTNMPAQIPTPVQPLSDIEAESTSESSLHYGRLLWVGQNYIPILAGGLVGSVALATYFIYRKRGLPINRRKERYKAYLARLEELRNQGRIGEATYVELKREYERKITRK